MSKRRILNFFIIAVILVAVLTPLSVFGQGGFSRVLAAEPAVNQAQSGLQATADQAGLAKGELLPIIGLFIKRILGFLGVIFVLLLLYGGFLRMTAQGSPDKIKQSTGIITSAVVGVAIILSAYIITTFVFDQIGETIKGGGSNSSGSGNSGKSCNVGESCVCSNGDLG